jgi:hypothetical protein
MENSIIYTNFMIFNDRKLAFKNKMLFDITQVPFLIPFKNNYWIVNKKKLTILKAKSIIKKEQIEVDVSSLQWYQKIHLKECFNL